MNINLTILGQIIQIIGCFCSLWVYIDASRHKIGRIPEGGFFNIGAGWWGPKLPYMDNRIPLIYYPKKKINRYSKNTSY